MIEVLNYTNIQKGAISMKMFSPIRMITAVFFLIGAALGAPAPVSDAGLSVGQTAYAAQVSAKEQGPSYWQMYYNFAPPTDAFIAGLAAEQGVELIDEAQVRAITAATIGKDESELSMWEIKLKTRDHDKRYRNDGQTFSPVYKVECHAGTMEYELRIDAVTGDVLSYEAEVDDDRF